MSVGENLGTIGTHWDFNNLFENCPSENHQQCRREKGRDLTRPVTTAPI